MTKFVKYTFILDDKYITLDIPESMVHYADEIGKISEGNSDKFKDAYSRLDVTSTLFALTQNSIAFPYDLEKCMVHMLMHSINLISFTYTNCDKVEYPKYGNLPNHLILALLALNGGKPILPGDHQFIMIFHSIFSARMSFRTKEWRGICRTFGKMISRRECDKDAGIYTPCRPHVISSGEILERLNQIEKFYENEYSVGQLAPIRKGKSSVLHKIVNIHALDDVTFRIYCTDVLGLKVDITVITSRGLVVADYISKISSILDGLDSADTRLACGFILSEEGNRIAMMLPYLRLLNCRGLGQNDLYTNVLEKINKYDSQISFFAAGMDLMLGLIPEQKTIEEAYCLGHSHDE